ncbi:MAG: Serine-protein kinase RsbW [Syntrophus sp. PtaB.Bin075]|jgi:serine/threonine-protein kinase RsbW|nr:MAG: Serine-protein kinase RsbW [Syntrophus sp. PtaB.Bin075]
MEPAGSNIKLMIESRIENVSLLGGAVRGIANALSLDELSCYQLELCVVEAVSNATKHAYHSEQGHPVEVDVLLFRDRITFKISDQGDSLKSPKVKLLRFDPQNLETVPESGMGLFIMHALMDEVSYETVSGRNILTMSKYLRKQGPSV